VVNKTGQMTGFVIPAIVIPGERSEGTEPVSIAAQQLIYYACGASFRLRRSLWIPAFAGMTLWLEIQQTKWELIPFAPRRGAECNEAG